MLRLQCARCHGWFYAKRRRKYCSAKCKRLATQAPR